MIFMIIMIIHELIMVKVKGTCTVQGWLEKEMIHTSVIYMDQ